MIDKWFLIDVTDNKQGYRPSSVHQSRKLGGLLVRGLTGRNPRRGKVKVWPGAGEGEHLREQCHHHQHHHNLVAGVGDLLPGVEHRLGGEQRSIGRLARVTTLLAWQLILDNDDGDGDGDGGDDNDDDGDGDGDGDNDDDGDGDGSGWPHSSPILNSILHPESVVVSEQTIILDLTLFLQILFLEN